MLGKTDADWKATRAIMTGDFELVFVEESDGVYVHYLKDSAYILDALEDYPEIVESSSIDNYQAFDKDGRVYFPNISYPELLDKLNIDQVSVFTIVD